MSYSKMFKDTSVAYDLSPRKSVGKKSGMSPGRSTYSSKLSVSQIGPSPNRFQKALDMHKKTGVELRDSPSKAAKIVMRYINNYQDVGPIIQQPPITYSNLVELGKEIDKKEVWVKSDLRLIFSIEDSQAIDETLETLNRILTRESSFV